MRRDPWAVLRARPLACSCAGAVALVLALTSQVFGWLLLSVPLRTLRATTTSVVLNAQPVATPTPAGPTRS